MTAKTEITPAARAAKRREIADALVGQLVAMGAPASVGAVIAIDFGNKIGLGFQLEPPSLTVPRWRLRIADQWFQERALNGYDYRKIAAAVLVRRERMLHERTVRVELDALEAEALRIDTLHAVAQPFSVRVERHQIVLKMNAVQATEAQIAAMMTAARACGLVDPPAAPTEEGSSS